jgi:hypothetical protein
LMFWALKCESIEKNSLNTEIIDPNNSRLHRAIS